MPLLSRIRDAPPPMEMGWQQGVVTRERLRARLFEGTKRPMSMELFESR